MQLARVAAVSDEQILDAYRWLAAGEGVFCEPASPASVAGLFAHGLPTVEDVAPPESVVCVLTGHGLKDPDTALSKAPAVINCENDLSAVERVRGERIRWRALRTYPGRGIAPLDTAQDAARIRPRRGSHMALPCGIRAVTAPLGPEPSQGHVPYRDRSLTGHAPQPARQERTAAPRRNGGGCGAGHSRSGSG